MFYFLINKLFQWKTVVTLYVLKDSFPFSLYDLYLHALFKLLLIGDTSLTPAPVIV